MYILAPVGAAAKYPYTLAELRRDNPNTSFPIDPDEATLAEWNVYPVEPTERPAHDYTKNVVEDAPALRNGRWSQAWKMGDATLTEIEARTKEKAAELRAERNSRLRQCDWTVLPDSPTDRGVWTVYRQALRDITKQAAFPWGVTWPKEPAE